MNSDGELRWIERSKPAAEDRVMKQKIKGYHKDAEDHWVAELECGHAQHVRHDPPWMVREWVVTESGRAERLGMELNCVRCDELGADVARAVLDAAREAIREAANGRPLTVEAALEALDQLPLRKIVESALSKP